MPVDSSIALAIQPPQPNPANSYGAAVQNQSFADQAAAMRKQRIQDASDLAAIGAAQQQHQLPDGTIDYDAAINALAGQPTALTKLQTMVDAHRKNIAESAEKDIATKQKQFELGRSIGNSIVDAPSLSAGLPLMATLNPALAAAIGPQYVPGDADTPGSTASKLRQASLQAAPIEQQLAAQAQAVKMARDAGTDADKHYQAALNGLATAPDDQTYASWLAGAKLAATTSKLSEDDKARLLQQIATLPQTRTPQGQQALQAQLLTPEQRQQAPIQKEEAAAKTTAAKAELLKAQTEAGQAGAGTGGAGLGLPAPEAPGVRHPEALGGLPTGQAEIAKGIGDYTFPLPSGMALKTPYWQNLIAQATRYNPNLDLTQYGVRFQARKDFTSGKTADTLTALNTAIGHLDSLDKAGEALGNTSAQPVNYVKNALSNTFGGTAPGHFDVDADAVASELTKVFRATGGSEADVQAWRKTLTNSASGPQIKDRIGAAVDLLGSRIDAVKERYQNAMGEPLNQSFLTPKSKAILARISPDLVAKIEGAAAPASTPQPKTIAGVSYAPQSDGTLKSPGGGIYKDNGDGTLTRIR